MRCVPTQQHARRKRTRRINAGRDELRFLSQAGAPRKPCGCPWANRNKLGVWIGSDDKMDKRLAKRHKREVSRKKQHVKLSEPDVRTPEQIKAAREASRATMARGTDAGVKNTALSSGSRQAPGTGSAAKTDV